MKRLENYFQKETDQSRSFLSHSRNLEKLQQLRKEHNFPSDEHGAQLQINPDLSKAKFDQHLLTNTDSLMLSQKQELFEKPLQSPFHEVLDSSGKVIFTENDYHYYQYCKKQIVTAIDKEDHVLIDSLRKIPFFKDLYDRKVGVREGYTLQEHTSMVLEQFRKYQMKNWESSLLTAKEFQLMLAIHDIGKPQAVLETGKKSKQHEYNGRIIPGFVKWLGIPEEKSKLIVALTMQDHVGGFLQQASHMVFKFKKKQKARKTAERMLEEAANIGIGVEQYFDLITRYYRADAGSYTTEANPQAEVHLNHLFEKKTALNCTRAFSEKTQKNYDILANEIKFIAFCKDFITHYENIQNVYSVIEANNINKWIDAGKYLPQGHEFGKALQAKIQAVHSSLEGLAHLFSGKDNQAHASREEEAVSFATKEWSKLEEMKRTIEGIKLGSDGKKALETMKVCYQETEKRLSLMSNHSQTLGALDNSLKDVSRRLYDLALVEANKLNLEMKNNNWDESTIANIVEDKSYSEYAQQCFQGLHTQLERYIGLVKGKETAPAVLQSLDPSEQRHSQEIQEANLSDDCKKQHDQEVAEQLLTALKDLTASYDQVVTVKYVIELAQARKNFKETRDPQPVRKALEKFESPQHLREYHRELSTKYWIKQSIAKVNDELMLEAINMVANREKSALENVDQGLNLLNHPNHSLDDSAVVFEIENTSVRLEKAQLRKKWSKKEWFSKLDDGPIKQILKEYCGSYLKALDKKVQHLVQEGDPQIWIRCQPETLRKILEDGRFKSQFETHTSSGRLNKKRRAKSEYGRAGIPLNMPTPFRFIYGYAANKPSGKAPIIKNVEWFGPVAVRLKPELREFALQMLDDSKKHSDGKSFLTCRPTFFDNADRRCFPSRSLPLRYKLFFEDNPFKIQGREDLTKKIPYQEVQMVRVDKEDIQEVVFCTPMVNKKLKNLLEQHAIAYRRRVKLFTVLTWCLYPPFRSLLRAGDAIAYNPHSAVYRDTKIELAKGRAK